jgi:pimeloyl-ACP methyl ester carboxylesterase
MSVEIHPADHRPTANELPVAPRGPVARIVAGSLAIGIVAALVLTMLVFAGGRESAITGSVLLAFGFGWAMMGVLFDRLTNRPQRWTAVPAVAMGVTGLGLLVFTPENAVMTFLGWVWPVPMLAFAVFIWVRIRRDLPGRGRWTVAPVVAVLGIASIAAVYEDVAVVYDQHTYAAPGRSYDVGGHRLYLDCRGHGGPTVVLFNGLGEVTASWARIVPRVDATTRVCAYDRAGQGWSGDVDGAQDGVTAAIDLHTLLRVAGEHGPFVLVGHSIGGTYALTYAARYPGQVAGMVLLDSSSPEQFTKIPSYAGQYAVIHRIEALTPTLNRLGIGRLIAAVAPSQLPGAAADQVRALTASAHGARNARDDWSILHKVFGQAQALTSFGSHPLAVLTATESLHGTGGWAAAQDKLAALSSNRLHQVVDSTHLGLQEDPQPSTQAANAIDDVITAVRTGSQLHRR